ncbi:MAG TPA: PKD domain-containing protein [Phycisphaerae bacterium]|nr:PKD domain-containing protein [Phycisphaerae bacterium]HON69078.1 PKD domain-containing protein [Phycisphaerae bacterium]HOQ85631.1 PKD domain-containing protein [Phycisphaerae bacterium]HPP29076.1 PKD domain-containing protein [Phycisphaerae bacterium]HPU25965.1 PKD domain-containing protein [Phycisphaerae bacterium]
MYLVLVGVSLIPWLWGCPPAPPPDGNNPPVANAGANQSVRPGATVTLNGSASTDPDGDTLTFSWTQTAGIAVTLDGATTATPTFVAPAVATTLTFELTVSDGQQSDSDSVDVGVDTNVEQTPILFVANITGNNVTAYKVADPDDVNGNIAPAANLAGAQTGLNQPADMVVEALGSLLVVNAGGDSITSYPGADDLTGVNGNVAPDRNVQGAATQLVVPATLAIRPESELLFVGDLTANSIFVFGGVSTNAFNGNLAPLRTITSPDLQGPIGINFGANDTLYVANSAGVPRVSVFANASTLNGNVAATRVITSTVFNGLFDVFVDANDRMYVVDVIDDQVHVFNNASTLNGNVAPSVTLTIPGAGQLTAIAVDRQGVGYVVDNTLNAVYSYDNIASRNGTVTPDRVLQGANTQLTNPIRVFLLE